MTSFARSALAAALIAAPAASLAVTLTEGAGPGFSSLRAAPTLVAPGVTRIEGRGAQNDPDFLIFSDLMAGPQVFTFTFSAPGEVGWSYAAGGALLWRDDRFRWNWDGATAFTFALDHGRRTATGALALGDGFSGGDLHLALYFTHGALSYRIDAPSNARMAAGSDGGVAAVVPLPASGLLLLAAAGALAAFRRRG